MPEPTFYGKKPLGYQQLTVSTAAVGLTVPTRTIDTGDRRGTGAVNQPVRVAFCRVETNGVRWRDDSTDPTASVGQPMSANDVLTYDGDVTALKFIRSGAADATLNVSYY